VRGTAWRFRDLVATNGGMLQADNGPEQAFCDRSFELPDLEKIERHQLCKMWRAEDWRPPAHCSHLNPDVSYHGAIFGRTVLRAFRPLSPEASAHTS